MEEDDEQYEKIPDGVVGVLFDADDSGGVEGMQVLCSVPGDDFELKERFYEDDCLELIHKVNNFVV